MSRDREVKSLQRRPRRERAGATGATRGAWPRSGARRLVKAARQVAHDEDVARCSVRLVEAAVKRWLAEPGDSGPQAITDVEKIAFRAGAPRLAERRSTGPDAEAIVADLHRSHLRVAELGTAFKVVDRSPRRPRRPSPRHLDDVVPGAAVLLERRARRVGRRHAATWTGQTS